MRTPVRVVVATRPGPVTDALLGQRIEGIEMAALSGPPLVRDDRAEILCVGGPIAAPIRDIVASLPRLRWIHALTAGVDRFLVPEVVRREDIFMTNSSGAHEGPMAEFVIAAVFLAAKALPSYVRDHDARRWSAFDDRAEHRAVRGSTILIVGPGGIGREVARMARGIGMRVLAVGRSGRPLAEADETGTAADLTRLARGADFVAVTAALTPETRGLVSREVIAALPAHAWIMNVARGPIVDEAALLEAVRERRIGGAVLDALWEEPLPADSPWWSAPNVLVTAHSSAGRVGITARLRSFHENVRLYLDGDPLVNVVDKRAGY